MINKTKSSAKTLAKTLFVITTVAAATSSFAAEGFRSHFATAGTLGENIFSSDIKPGFIAGIGYKQAESRELSDGSGNTVGTAENRAPLAVQLPVNAQLGPVSGQKVTGTSLVSYSNSIKQEYIFFGYTSESQYAGGNLSAMIIVPYTKFDKTVKYSGADLYYAGQSIGAQLNPYVANSMSTSSTASAAKVDDIEIGGSWDFKKSENTKYSVGLALTTKTGGYEPTQPGASVGQGFYTLKPSFTSITQDGLLSYAYKATLGVNTANNDLYGYKGGNILSLEGAVGYKTSVGAFGLKVHSLKQIQDDKANANILPQYAPQADGNRISFTTLTAYYTVPVKPLESVFYVGVSSMQKSTYSTVPQSGYFEMRLSKAFN